MESCEQLTLIPYHNITHKQHITQTTTTNNPQREVNIKYFSMFDEKPWFLLTKCIPVQLWLE